MTIESQYGEYTIEYEPKNQDVYRIGSRIYLCDFDSRIEVLLGEYFDVADAKYVLEYFNTRPHGCVEHFRFPQPGNANLMHYYLHGEGTGAIIYEQEPWMVQGEDHTPNYGTTDPRYVWRFSN